MAERLFHIGIKALIQDRQGNVLLVGNGSHDGQQKYMDLPGGRMDAGEQFLDTLERELQEEIGTSYIGNPEYFDTVLSNVQPLAEHGRVGLVLIVYRAVLPNGVVLQLGEQEYTYEWCEPAKAAELLAFKFPEEFCRKVAELA